MIIAIDGPSGAGKSTVAKLISEKLNFVYIDTGAMYRALAYKAYKNNMEICEITVQKMLSNTKIDYCNNSIFLDNENIEEYIRNDNISIIASDISKYKIVREKMVDLQRLIAQNKNVVMDGRDIGTVVFPNADYKFFITASKEKRAERRYEELKENGLNVTYNKVLSDIEARDKNDANRKNSPLKKADDAILIDTTNIDIQKIVDKIIYIVSEGLNAI
jgi:cytidylate kinase